MDEEKTEELQKTGNTGSSLVFLKIFPKTKILIGLISSFISMIFVMLFIYIALEFFDVLFVDFLPEPGQDDMGIGILMMGWLLIVGLIGAVIWIVVSIIIFIIFSKCNRRSDNG